MKRVTGIGGIFFKCKDPSKTKEWYDKHLGIDSDQWGNSFEWLKADGSGLKGHTAWSPMKHSTDYFSPSNSQFMVNYRVADIEKLVTLLKEEGVQVLDEIEVYEYGKFVHILDPDGVKIELWEPNDEAYEKILKVKMKSS